MANQFLPGVNTIPNSLLITAITQSSPMVVTVSLTNDSAPNPRVNTYQVGMNVRLFVPWSYGMYQANGLVGNIKAVSGNVFILDLDSSLFDAFVVPSGTAETPASIARVGGGLTELQVPIQIHRA